MCFTAATGRTHFRHRLAVAGGSVTDLRASLVAWTGGRETKRTFAGERAVAAGPGLVFVFTGQGSQYPGMGRRLYESHPVFRRAMDECDALLRPHLERPLVSVLYQEEGRAPLIDRTEYSQPALFALEWALVEAWRSWGVQPAAVIGHSVGEYVAACVAGVISLADALALVAVRGRAMQRLPDGGAMAAVFADEHTVTDAIGAAAAGTVSIAAVNSPVQCVIAGPAADVARVTARLESKGRTCEPLNVSHAFHSSLMTPSLDEWLRGFDGLSLRAPRIPLISNVTGREADPADIVRRDYWRRHALQPVRFGDGIATLRAKGFRTFLEIGPHPTLSALARQAWSLDTARDQRGGAATWAGSLHRRRADRAQMLDARAALYASGVDIDWTPDYAGQSRSVVSLPTYPFERQRFWPEAASRRSIARSATDHPVLGARVHVAGQPGEVWTRQISVEDDEWLRDHRVEGAVVFPGAAYIEAALAAAAARGEEVELTRLRFERALVLDSDEAVELQTQIVPQPDGHAKASIYSRRNPGPWILHAELDLAPAEATAHRSVDTPGLIDGLIVNAPADFYQSWAARGNAWGPCFQGIAELWRGDREAVARLAVPAALGDLRDRRAHPAMLDSAVQVLAAAVPDPPAGAFVGRSVEAVRIFKPLTGTLWSHATLASGPPAGDGQIEGHVTLFDDRGERVADSRWRAIRVPRCGDSRVA